MDFKKFLKEKGVSEEDFAKKTPEEMAQLHSEFNAEQFDSLKELIGKSATPDDVAKATKALEDYKASQEKASEGFATKDQLTKLEESLKNAEAELLSMKEKGSKATENPVAEALKAAKENISKSITSKGNDIDVVVKAATVVGSVVGNTNSLRLSEIEKLAHRKISLLDIFPTQIVPADHSGNIDYVDWDEATSVRAAATVAEGAAFPESTATWKQESIKMKKIGDTIPVSEEFGKDEASLVSEVEEFLRTNVMLEEEAQVYAGGGTGSDLLGFYTSAPAYVPVASGITDANIYDLAIKVGEDISRGKKSRFAPNTAVMNIKTINDFLLKKDVDNNYLRPPFFSDNGVMKIGNLTVIESNLVADNTMCVFDSSKAKIYTGDEYTLTTGYVDAQFGADMATLKARKRMLLLVKESNKAAFRKVTSISAALTTLASAPI